MKIGPTETENLCVLNETEDLIFKINTLLRLLYCNNIAKHLYYKSKRYSCKKIDMFLCGKCFCHC